MADENEAKPRWWAQYVRGSLVVLVVQAVALQAGLRALIDGSAPPLIAWSFVGASAITTVFLGVVYVHDVRRSS